MYNESDTLAILPIYFFIATMIIATVSDVISHRIPNKVLAPALAVAFVLSATTQGVFGLSLALAGMAVGLAMLLPVYAVGAMGAGDVKMLAVAGAYLGPHGALLAGAILGLFWLAHRFLRPFALHWFQGLAGSLNRATSSDHGVLAGEKSNTFAYAPAIAIGVVTSFWQLGWQLPGFAGG